MISFSSLFRTTGARCLQALAVGLFLFLSDPAAAQVRAQACAPSSGVACSPTVLPDRGEPQSGWWWNATEAGRGYSIEITRASSPARAYFGAFMYDQEGRPVWYAAMLTGSEDGRSFAGSLKYFRRGLTSVATSASSPAGIDAGNIRIDFSSATEGAITLVSGDGSRADVVIGISRFAIVGGGVLATAAVANPAYPEVGWWWNPAQPGNGLFFEVQSDDANGPTLFGVIYSYEADGTPSWLVGTAPLLQSAGGWVALSMALHRCTGGQILGSTGPKPPTCVPVPAGGTSVQFESAGTTGIVTLADGSLIPIQRFEF